MSGRLSFLVKFISYYVCFFSLGIFFYENLDCATKAALKNGVFVNDYQLRNENLADFFKSDKKTLETNSN